MMKIADSPSAASTASGPPPSWMVGQYSRLMPVLYRAFSIRSWIM
jgi:hypothetical protein